MVLSRVRFPNDGGNTLILVSPISKYFKLFIFGWMLGNFLSFEQYKTLKYSSDFIMRQSGRSWSSEQPLRSHTTSLSRRPTDWWTSTKLLQSERTNSFRFGVDIDKSGNFVMYLQERKSIYFRVLDCKLCNNQKKKKIEFSFNKF